MAAPQASYNELKSEQMPAIIPAAFGAGYSAITVKTTPPTLIPRRVEYGYPRLSAHGSHVLGIEPADIRWLLQFQATNVSYVRKILAKFYAYRSGGRYILKSEVSDYDEWHNVEFAGLEYTITPLPVATPGGEPVVIAELDVRWRWLAPQYVAS